MTDFFINLHYLYEPIKKYFGDGTKWDIRVHYSREPKILGTAGGVKQFESRLNDLFFVMYGDMFSLVNYSKMAAMFSSLPEDALGLMIVGRNDHPHDSDLVEVDNDLRFLKLHLKPHNRRDLPPTFRTLDAGYIFRKRILDYVPAEKYYEIDHQLLPDILARGEKFYGYETSDYLKDIGTMERYREVEKYAKKNQVNH